MKRFVTILLLCLLPVVSARAVSMGFRGAAGFSVAVFQPDLDPVNQELRALGMPELDDPMLLYGAQIFGHLSDPVRIGLMAFTGRSRVEDFQSGYAREASFSLNWYSFLVEYRYEFSRFEAFGGGSIGFGGADIRIEKTISPVNWDEIWDSYQLTPNSSDNISTIIHQNFLLLQPRVGLRYYLLDWLALSGTVEVPLVRLQSENWTVSDSDVYGAPDIDLTRPFFHFSVLLGI